MHAFMYMHTYIRTGTYKGTDVYRAHEDDDHLVDKSSSCSLAACLLNELKVLGMLVIGSSVFIISGILI